MRFSFLFREVVTGLRRNVTMTIAMILTTAISLGLLGTGLLAVNTLDQTEELYGDRLELVVSPGLPISNMVQLSADNRRTEVGVMRLVGATRWYTQLPFLLEAAVTGVVGTALAVGSLLLGKGLFLDKVMSGFGEGVLPTIG